MYSGGTLAAIVSLSGKPADVAVRSGHYSAAAGPAD